MAWIKSSCSGSSDGDCVEVAAGPRAVQVRDSKSAHGPLLSVPPRQWAGAVPCAALSHSAVPRAAGPYAPH